MIKPRLLSIGLILCSVLGAMLAVRCSESFPIPLPAVSILSLTVVLIGMSRGATFNLPLTLLVTVCALSLAIHPYPSPWLRCQRLVAFGIGMLCFSPLLQTSSLDALRMRLAKWIFATLSLMVVVSFGMWMHCIMTYGADGIWLRQFHYYGFTGMFERGMQLSPAAAVVAIVCASRCVYAHRQACKMAYFCLLVIGIIMCVAGGSRIAVFGLIVSLSITLWHYRNPLMRRLRHRNVMIGAICGAMALTAAMPAAISVIAYKQEIGERHGSFLYSRQQLFDDRLTEFASSPFIGIGYANEFPSENNEGDVKKIEPGSSWLSLLSYTGAAGTMTFLWFIGATVIRIKRQWPLGQRSLRMEVPLLVFSLINATTEGWLLFSGSLMFPIFWLTLSFIWGNHDTNPVTTTQ